MLPILQIGPLSLPTVPLLWNLGFWVFSEAAESGAKETSLDAKRVSQVVTLAVLFGLVGARLAYVLQYPNLFAENPLSVVSPRPYLLSLEGGLLFGGFGLLVLAQRKGMPILRLLDALSPGFAFWLALVGLAWQAEGVFPGRGAILASGGYLPGGLTHPANLYWAMGFAVGGFLGRRALREHGFTGDVFLGSVLLGGWFAILHAFFRADMGASRSIEALVGCAVLILAGWLIYHRTRKTS